MTPRRTLLLGALVLAAVGCNEALVPDYNNLTAYPSTPASLQNQFSGVFNAPRNSNFTDLFWFELSTDGMARSVAYWTPSEDRFVTQYTGGVPLDKDNFGARVWDNEFNGVKAADTVLAHVAGLTNATGQHISAPDAAGLTGVLQTERALFYMYLELTHDTLGIPIDGVGKSFTTPAPILCAPSAWKRIVAILDSADAALKTAGGDTLGAKVANFTLTLPTTYAAVSVGGSGSDYSGTSFDAFTLALRARAELEYAYAIGRAAGGTSRPTANNAGSPDVTQLNAAIADVQASKLYSAALSAGEANATNDLGVFHAFSAAPGDVQNPLFGQAKATYVLQSAANQIDTLNDQRFLAKFGATGTPNNTLVGYQYASDFTYAKNISASTPMPIVRNLELQFILARAYLGLGNYALASQTVDAVRVAVGGLPSGLTAANQSQYVAARDFLMREMLPTLMLDGTGDQIVALRDYGIAAQNDSTWGSADTHTSTLNIPQTESDGRSGNIACVNQ
ncbi:MAG TPA: hypothetical protein VFA43_02410 [Gemmatimonadaceae bacterium]|nr:hypothetical protein [Gemmatimonadaceae bacterium]